MDSASQEFSKLEFLQKWKSAKWKRTIPFHHNHVTYFNSNHEKFSLCCHKMCTEEDRSEWGACIISDAIYDGTSVGISDSFKWACFTCLCWVCCIFYNCHGCHGVYHCHVLCMKVCWYMQMNVGRWSGPDDRYHWLRKLTSTIDSRTSAGSAMIRQLLVPPILINFLYTLNGYFLSCILNILALNHLTSHNLCLSISQSVWPLIFLPFFHFAAAAATVFELMGYQEVCPLISHLTSASYEHLLTLNLQAPQPKKNSGQLQPDPHFIIWDHSSTVQQTYIKTPITGNLHSYRGEMPV